MELLTAAKHGNLVLVRALCSHPSCDLLARDEDGNTALHIAASRGHHEVVLELASRYTTASSESIAGMNNEGDTPLHLACRNGSMKCVKILANMFPIDLTMNNSSGDTPLTAALLGEHNEVVLLLNQKYDVCIESDQNSGMLAGNIKAVEKASKSNPMLAACLLAAAKQGSLVLVRALLSHPSCDLLARDEDGNTALHIAASRGHHEVVLELASRYMTLPSEASAGVNSEGQTPLHLACYKGWLKCIDPLVIKFPKELNVHDVSGNTPLMASSLAGHDKIILLLKERYKVNGKSKGCESTARRENKEKKSKCKKNSLTLVTSCLLAAAKTGSLVLVKALLFHPSCDLLARDEDGNTALHIAASRGHHELVLELASRCMKELSEVSTRINDKGQTALHLACCKGWVECVRTLAAMFPGDLKVKNEYDNLPLHDAALFGHSYVVDTLCQEFGEDVDSLGHCDNTVLILACCGGHINLGSNLLLKYQCQGDVLDETGGLATSCAASYGHTHLLQMLIDEFKFSPTSVRLTDGLSLLHLACGGKHYETANTLITKYQLVPTAKDLLGCTALHTVCGFCIDSLENVGDFDFPSDVEVTSFVDWLIRLKCDPMDKDKQGLTTLHYAALSGQTQVVKLLVKKYHCTVECRDNNDHTPLHVAAKKGHTHVVQVLVSELGADVEARNKQNDTILNMAALNGHSDVVTLLVDQFGCSPHIKGYNNRTLLHHACMGGHLELVEKLIDSYHCDSMARDDEGLTPLHIAALAGKEHVVRQLVSKYDCVVECRDNNDRTPLHVAAAKGHTHVVQVLVSELGADVKARNKQNDTILNMAALNGHSDVVSLLVDQFGCSPHIKGYNNRTLLHHACMGGHLELVEKLIDSYHCNSMARDDEGLTPLHITALAGKEHVVRQLVSKYDCPVECRDNDEATPLHGAAAKGHAHVVEVLLSELGADVEARNKNNNTPLHFAALNGHRNVVTLLVDQFGCNPDTKGYNNRTVLHYACMDGHLELVEKLIDSYHCNSMARDNEGLTPLHIAALAGKEHVVRQLVSKYDCSVECRDNNDHTPLHKAAARGHTHVVQVLLSELGADVEAHNKNNNTILNIAALNGHSNVVTLLVDQLGCDPHTKGYINRTLLHHACMGGHLELVEKLIDSYHCDSMARDDKGLTPLHIAAMAGKEHVVRQLVSKYDCVVECRDNDDHTPLHGAAVKGHTHVVHVLVSELGADVEARNKQNDTILNMAALNGHSDVVSLLVDQFGCSPDTKGYNNRTVLHQACWSGHLELVEKLIDSYHCDSMARDDEGLTPLHIAALEEKKSILSVKQSIMTTLLLKYKCSPHIFDREGNTLLHLFVNKGSNKIVRMLVDIIGAFSSVKNNQGKTPLDWHPIQLLEPSVKACVEYLSQHAVGEYRHAPHKLLVFDNDIILFLNTYSTYSLFCSTSAQSCGICYMDSIDSDIWVCHVPPDAPHSSVLQSLMLAPFVMAVITVDFSIPTAQAVCKVISQVSLIKENAFRNESIPVPVRILLIGFSSHNKESLFKTICQTVITNQKSDSIQFSQQILVCQDGECQQQLYPVLSQFISTSVGTVPNPEVLEITHGSICLLKFLYRETQNKSYISFSDLSKQLQNERIMTEDNPEEIHACLRQLDEQGYLVITGTFDNPQCIILNPLQLLHTIDEFLCNVTELTEPLVLVGFCSKKLLSSCVDLGWECIESFMSKFNQSTVVSNALVNLLKKEDLYKPIKHSYCFIPKLATCQRQITHWTCQPDIVFSCGLSIVAVRKENTFSSQFVSTTLLQAIKLFTSSYLVEPYRGLECNLWKDGVHWMAEKVEVLLEVVDGERCVLLMGRSDICRQLQCTDMFAKVVDMVMDVKSQCCGETLHKIEVLDPAALQSHRIPSATELLWCDATSVIRATRIGKAAIQSICKTKQFSVKKMDWLHRFTLHGKCSTFSYMCSGVSRGGARLHPPQPTRSRRSRRQ